MRKPPLRQQRLGAALRAQGTWRVGPRLSRLSTRRVFLAPPAPFMFVRAEASQASKGKQGAGGGLCPGTLSLIQV